MAAFEDAEIPKADLIYAGYALPFVHPGSFPRVWHQIRQALRPGAWLAVDLFGERDSWAIEDDMTFLSRTRVEAMPAGLQVFALEEEDRDGHAFSGPKHWHVFHAIGRRS